MILPTTSSQTGLGCHYSQVPRTHSRQSCDQYWKKEFLCEITYVACSRVWQLTTLLLSPPFPSNDSVVLLMASAYMTGNYRIRDCSQGSYHLNIVLHPYPMTSQLQSAMDSLPHPLTPPSLFTLLPLSPLTTLVSFIHTTPSFFYEFSITQPSQPSQPLFVHPHPSPLSSMNSSSHTPHNPLFVHPHHPLCLLWTT